MKQIPLYDRDGKSTGAIDISFEVREANAHHAYALSVRSLLQGWRQGTVGCKTRGEVALSNRKPFKQKGTGRARAGTFRSPLWRKGGIIFGPQPRVAEHKITKKQKSLAFNATFAQALQAGTIVCVEDSFLSERPSTKQAQQVMRNLKINDKKVVLFASIDDINTYLSFRNLPNVHIVFFDQPNVFDLTNAESWVFLKKDINAFNEMVARWK